MFSLDRTGEVELQAFFDLNRSGIFEGNDRPLAGAEIGLRFPGSVDTLAFDTTGVTGELTFTEVPVGSLDLWVDADPFADSLVVSLREPSPLRVTRGALIPARLALSYPIVKISEARAWSTERRIFVDGVAVNAPGDLPGNAVHVRDATGWLRAEGTTGSTVNAGDSVRLRGVIHREGQSAVLRDALRLPLPGEGGSVTAITVGTAQARTAGPELDGALVRIETATVLQTVFQAGTATAQISDGSGPLLLWISGAHLVDARLPIPGAGGRLSVTGVLVPDAGGTQWTLQTRGGQDVEITSSGVMTGRVFIPEDEDEDGDDGGGLFQSTPLSDVRVLVRAAQLGGEVLGQAFTDSEGRFRIEPLPTGSYLLELDPFTYPDSLSVGEITPSPIPIRSDESTDVLVPLVVPVEGRLQPRNEG